MNRLFLFALISLTMAGCKKEDPKPRNNSGNGTTAYGYVVSDEGATFTMTLPDGTSTALNSSAVFGWNGGQLLNNNYWRGWHVGLPDGNTLFFRYNLTEDMEWEEEVAGESELFNQTFLLQWSNDMNDKYVEVYAPSSDQLEGNASGTVTCELDVNTSGGMYDLVGELDAEWNYNGLVTAIKGHFWKKEF